MTREQLDHLLRAASEIAGVRDLVVIGSQAVLGTHPDWELPEEATRSVEADIAVDLVLAGVGVGVGEGDATELADRIDGAIGEGSSFHRMYGYYAQGVEVATASLTSGWRERLVPVIAEAPGGPAVGWCLDINDAWVAKAAAGREKDFAYCGALAQAGLVDAAVCQERIALLNAGDRRRGQAVHKTSFTRGP